MRSKRVIPGSMASSEASLNPAGQGLAEAGPSPHLAFAMLVFRVRPRKVEREQYLPRPQEALPYLGTSGRLVSLLHLLSQRSNCDVVLLPREPVHHEEVHGELKSHH